MIALSPVARVHGVLNDAAPLPQPVWALIRGAGSIHMLWRLNRKRELYQDPDNWVGLIAGHLAGHYFDAGFLRTSAHMLHIATKVQEYADEVRLFREDVRDLAYAIDGYYLPTPPEAACESTFNAALLKAQAERARVRLCRIRLYSFRVVQRIFNLAMRLMDIYDSLYRTDEAMNELFVNGSRWMDHFSRNRVELAAGMRSVQEQMELVLRKWEIDVDVDAYISRINRIGEAMEHVATTYKRVGKSGGDFLKRSVAQYLVLGFGIQGVVPSSWFGPVRHPRFVIEPKS